jgi:hypothetical protein
MPRTILSAGLTAALALSLPLGTQAAELPQPPPQFDRVNPTHDLSDALQWARGQYLDWRPTAPKPGDAVDTWESRTCANLIDAGQHDYELGLVEGVAGSLAGFVAAVIAATLIRFIWGVTGVWSERRARAKGAI